jgi:type I restriction enzyme S subunit
MANRSAGWTRVRFGEVVRQVKTKVDPETAGIERYVAGEHMDTDDLRIRRWGEVGDGYLGPAFHMRFGPGQVLYGSRRTYLRKIAIADFEGICANTTFVLEPADPSKMLPEFLPFAMQADSFHEHSKRESKGSVNPYVNFSDLAWYEFALPPLDEQRHIIQVLRAALVAANELEAALRAHDAVTQAHSHTLLSSASQGDGDVTTLGKVTRRLRVGVASSATHAYREAGVPFLRNTNIKAGRIDTSDMLYVDPAYAEINRSKRLSQGDIVMTRTDTHMPGVAAVVPPELDGAQAFTILICTPETSLLDPFYLCQWINGAPGRSFIRTRRGGGAQQNLGATLLADMPIRVPSLSRQRALVERLQEVERASLHLTERLQATRALARAIQISALGLQP